MKKIFFLLVSIIYYGTTMAQITLIPDSYFEQILITQNIDSDGVVNGQVLTSDVAGITNLVIDGSQMSNATGIEAFISLEQLTIRNTNITTLNVTQNTQLRVLNCELNALTQIDVSQNTLLEELYCGNMDDVASTNQISYIDLSNNPNIRVLRAVQMGHLYLGGINLANGNNNPQMYIVVPEFDIVDICMQVDNSAAANAGLAPYSSWNIVGNISYSSQSCVLANPSQLQTKVSIYPNPVKDILNINSEELVDKISVFDIWGRKTLEIVNANQINVEQLAKGIYIVEMLIDKKIVSEKFIKE